MVEIDDIGHFDFIGISDFIDTVPRLYNITGIVHGDSPFLLITIFLRGIGWEKKLMTKNTNNFSGWCIQV